METLAHNAALAAHIKPLKAAGKRIAFVPTMGALHEGHLSLVRAAKKQAEHVIVSIFVNPTQFGPNEDFEQYPRQTKQDLALLEAEGAGAVYTPSVEDIYPKQATSTLSAAPEAGMLCGASRPGHFDGVITVVHRLFSLVQPDIALFGEKDFQQLWLIKAMVKEQGLPVEVIGVPTVREADGLALSSRNQYLSVYQRSLAPSLYHAMQALAQRMHAQDAPLRSMVTETAAQLKAAGFDLDYLEVRDGTTLALLETFTPEIHHKARIFIAARLGNTRLIDNIAVSGA